jgi:hypothetical protein
VPSGSPSGRQGWLWDPRRSTALVLLRDAGERGRQVTQSGPSRSGWPPAGRSPTRTSHRRARRWRIGPMLTRHQSPTPDRTLSGVGSRAGTADTASRGLRCAKASTGRRRRAPLLLLLRLPWPYSPFGVSRRAGTSQNRVGRAGAGPWRPVVRVPAEGAKARGCPHGSVTDSVPGMPGRKMRRPERILRLATYRGSPDAPPARGRPGKGGRRAVVADSRGERTRSIPQHVRSSPWEARPWRAGPTRQSPGPSAAHRLLPRSQEERGQ